MMKNHILLILVLFGVVNCLFDVRQFGAVPKDDKVPTHFKNQEALQKAILAANSSATDRLVRIPKHDFYSMPVTLQNIHNITLIVQGRWAASKNVKQWPRRPIGKNYQDFIFFGNSSFITIKGGGTIDGRGYHWWLITILTVKSLITDQNYRPHLIRMEDCTYIEIYNITMKNSPQFHLKMDRCYYAKLHDIKIQVNTTAQIDIYKRFYLEGFLPLFPLNTDGIDPHGSDYHIYNIHSQNYDDVVVPKPGTKADKLSTCTENFLVENCTVVLGVGMSVGSVPPNRNTNCIRNITFRNIKMIRPLKGIYVKTNPGDVGDGIIQDILYQNITMDRPVWWAIYIGPQQMKEPDGDGPGCMFYPYDPKKQCGTQPRINVSSITLKDIKIHKSLLFPIVLRCNSTNPCKNITFDNVWVDKWVLYKKKASVCENAEVTQINTRPQLKCKKVDELEGLPFPHNNLKGSPLNLQQFRLMLQQMEAAAKEVGYNSTDDEFDYELDPEILESLQ